MTNMKGIIISLLFRKEICEENKKPKLYIFSSVSVIVPNNTFISYNIPLPCVVTTPPLINTVDMHLVMMPSVFVDQQNNSNLQVIYMNFTVVSARELTNDLKH